jgi:hypothetical protein
MVTKLWPFWGDTFTVTPSADVAVVVMVMVCTLAGVDVPVPVVVGVPVVVEVVAAVAVNTTFPVPADVEIPVPVVVMVPVVMEVPVRVEVLSLVASVTAVSVCPAVTVAVTVKVIGLVQGPSQWALRGASPSVPEFSVQARPNALKQATTPKKSDVFVLAIVMTGPSGRRNNASNVPVRRQQIQAFAQPQADCLPRKRQTLTQTSRVCRGHRPGARAQTPRR